MDMKLVLELSNHDVYYVKSDSVNFYITVPKNINDTNICIELKSKMANYNLELNDEVWVMENIKNTFSFIDEYNITLVLPVLNDPEISALEKINADKYEVIDKIMGQLINQAYMILKNQQVNINSQVILINNDRYKTFINWFVTRYQNRVVCKNLLELIQLFNVNATSYRKLETPGINFVVGSYNTEVDAPRVERVEEEAPVVQKRTPQYSSGYTSYLLLAIITIVSASIVAIIVFFLK